MVNHHEPAYVGLLQNGELQRRWELAWKHLHNCDLCARYCHVNRLRSAEGAACQTGERALVQSYGPYHPAEEAIGGGVGSGAIFFSHCNLDCVFCKNWPRSHCGLGREVEPNEMAAMMLELQEKGCHNINLVRPSHVVAQVIRAVFLAARNGLRLPLVYNTGGYDSLEALQILEGIVDVYLPDMKYGSSEAARRFSQATDYVERNREAVKEMYRQVGDLVLDEQGIARRGLLIRHLVLPGGLAETRKVLDFIAQEISPHTVIHLMQRYFPHYRADENPPLDRPLRLREYQDAVRLAEHYGFRRLHV